MKNETNARRRQVLHALEEKPATAVAISKAIGDAAVSRTLKAMERAKLVAREAGPEGALWRLTPEGKQTLGGKD